MTGHFNELFATCMSGETNAPCLLLRTQTSIFSFIIHNIFYVYSARRSEWLLIAPKHPERGREPLGRESLIMGITTIPSHTLAMKNELCVNPQLTSSGIWRKPKWNGPDTE